MWWELIQLMVSDVAIGETAPGVAPDWLGQVRQGLQHRYRCPSAHSNYGANDDQRDDTPSAHIVRTCCSVRLAVEGFALRAPAALDTMDG